MRKLNRMIAASTLVVPIALAASGTAVAEAAETSSGGQDLLGDALQGTPLEGSSVGNDESQSLESVLKVLRDPGNTDDLFTVGEGNSTNLED